MMSGRRGVMRAVAAWIGVLVGATVLMLLARDRLDKVHVALAYLLVILGASSAGGRVAGLTVVGGAFLAFDYLFLRPYYTLVIADPLDWLVLVAFLVTSVVATQLLDRERRTADTARRRAEEVDRLATLGAETMSAPDASAALDAIAVVIRDALGTDSCDLFRQSGDGTLVRAAHAERAGLVPSAPAPDASASGLIAWMAGRADVAVELPDGTTRLDPAGEEPLMVRALHRTLRVRTQPVGVLRVESRDGLLLSPDRARLLDALSYYAALGVERARLVATVERAEAERQAEALRSAILTAVSHDLRTPLTTIKGLAHEIAEGMSSASRAAVIEEEADHMDALVGDLLDLSRIQAGAVRPIAAVNTADELLGAALQRARGPLASHTVAVSVPDEVVAGRFDFSQALRILANLLENAAKYSPPRSGIEVLVSREGDRLVISVSDEGPGVSPHEADRIFEPFYRPRDTAPDVRGTGLGLAIARGLAEAQGGTLIYRARPTGGAQFILTLPAADAAAPESLLAE